MIRPRTLVLLFMLCVTGQAMASELEVKRLPDAVRDQTRLLNADYLVATPDEVSADAKLPLLIFLHGGGGRGEDIERVKRIANGALVGMRKFAGEPCLFVAPQAKMGTKEIPASWLPKDLDQLLGHLISTLPVDESRVYLTGTSMGGYGS